MRQKVNNTPVYYKAQKLRKYSFIYLPKITITIKVLTWMTHLNYWGM